MRKIKFVLLLAALPSSFALAQNGIYLGLEGGISSFSGLPSASNSAALSLDQSYFPNSIRASLGYNHDLFPRFGLGFEAGAGWYGQATYQYLNGLNSTITVNTIEFLGVGTVHVCPKFDLLIKIGGNRFDSVVQGVNASPTNTNISFQAGIGGAYNFTKHLALTVNYTHVLGKPIRHLSTIGWAQMPSVNEGLIGLRYNFGS